MLRRWRSRERVSVQVSGPIWWLPFAVALTFAAALILDLEVFPRRGLPILYAVPILITAWQGSVRAVGSVATLALLAQCIYLAVVHAPLESWPLTIAVLAVISFLAIRLTDQKAQIKALSGAAVVQADRAKAAMTRLTQLQAATSRLAEAFTMESVADVVISQCVTALGALGGSLCLLSDDGMTLEIIASTGYSAEQPGGWRRFRVDEPFPIAEAVRTRSPVWVETRNPLRGSYPRVVPFYGAVADRSWAAVPLYDGERLIGALGLSFSEDRSFSAAERMFILTMAGQGGVALCRARMLAAEQGAPDAAPDVLDQRSEFLAVVAHELRTPLTSLRGYAQLALSRLDDNRTLDPHFVQRAFTIIDRQSARLARLVSQLLDFAALSADHLHLTLSEVDVAAIVTNAVKAVQAASPRHTLRLSAPGSLLATADASRLGQVIDNLLENAIRYNPDRGTIDVQLTRLGADWLEISVRDDGPGIPVDQREGLFEPYYRAHAASHRSGLGLGLYVNRQVIKRHGGELVVEFPATGGTRFVIRLPVRIRDSSSISRPFDR